MINAVAAASKSPPAKVGITVVVDINAIAASILSPKIVFAENAITATSGTTTTNPTNQPTKPFLTVLSPSPAAIL